MLLNIAENDQRINQLAKILVDTGSAAKMLSLLQDLCTPAELKAMADRLHVLPLIADGVSYRDIHDETGVSVTTIGRVAKHINYGHGGYAALLEAKGIK
jgi:TrpR-related protein YerC/YecD